MLSSGKGTLALPEKRTMQYGLDAIRFVIIYSGGELVLKGLFSDFTMGVQGTVSSPGIRLTLDVFKYFDHCCDTAGVM